MELYGDPAETVTVKAGVKRNGLHVAVFRFTYQYGPSHTEHRNEMIRLGDLNRLIDDLTELAEKVGIR